MRRAPLVGAALLLFSISGCGYHQVGSASHMPAGVRTLAVPIFASRVQAFHTEMVFTQAVVNELNLRTRFRVETAVPGNAATAADGADATLRGTILSQSVTPLTYDSGSGQSSSYLVTITAAVTITSSSGRVLYRNDAFPWREQFQSTQDLSGSIQEDSAAVRRMGKDFAQALVSDVLESFQ